MLAAALASIIMPNIATETWGSIRKDWGYFYAYIIAASCMLAATLLFFATSPWYIQHKRSITHPNISWQMIKSILRSGNQSFRGGVALFGWLLTIPFFWASYYQAIRDDSNFAYVAFIIYFMQFSCLIWAHMDNSFIVILKRLRMVVPISTRFM